MWEEGWTPREKRLAAIAGVLVLVLAGVVFAVWQGEEPEADADWSAYEAKPVKPAQEKESKKKKEPAEVVVDVKGAVKKPGVYQLEPGSRVQDAVERAGGPHAKADMGQVNLAQPLSDGMALVIPAKGEKAGPPPPGSVSSSPGQASASQAGGAINLNTAEAADMEQLNGIGPSKAEAIIRYREENGPFSSVDQLTEVPGIGEKTLEQLRDQVTVQ
ncbi:helix-hairpin-helix domain-containing protein [Salinithrix halophila]|uniref:Helix-hairpin-helix domain-containing protein n=1 Tax=Salinithrix halophila TaxID=1485204 RepID=A0ABV8JDE9_9BACL